MKHQPSQQAADRGEPSYIWREGQQRRLGMILEAVGERLGGSCLEVGCGIGLYLEKLQPFSNSCIGLEYEYSRAWKAAQRAEIILNAAGEQLPFPANRFDVLLSNEVIEHVEDDAQTVKEMIRVLKPGGRLVLFCPNRWYPVETHGIYWRGKYRFGNIPLVNYLPTRWRNRLAPHVRAYTRKDLEVLFRGLPVRPVTKTVIFGGYDNIIHRNPRLGKLLRWIMYLTENTPLQALGLSHFWVLEKEG
jgi:SAM-dependent methyltransferase